MLNFCEMVMKMFTTFSDKFAGMPFFLILNFDDTFPCMTFSARFSSVSLRYEKRCKMHGVPKIFMYKISSKPEAI